MAGPRWPPGCWERLSLLSVGAIHSHAATEAPRSASESCLCSRYEKLYSAIPTIGTLFVLSFVGALVISAGLLCPSRKAAQEAG
jgi:hypothetical protein